MRFANVDGRMVIVDGAERALDVHGASAGRFGPDPAACLDDWEDFVAWARTAAGDWTTIDRSMLGPPSPSPRQCFAIGLNYRAHALETGVEPPAFPPTFTKFPTCLTGAFADITLPGAAVDYEVELVVVLGKHAKQVRAADAWSYVAGLSVGQDITEREVQQRPPVPQFSLSKSFPRFGPIGPWLVTVDEVDDPDDLELSCSVNGQVRQASRTSDLIFSVPDLIEVLSAITPLLPGDVIFTGTPAGIGAAATPPTFLRPGDVLVTTIGGIGTMTHRFVA
jgi:2,4-diketo-3-deoxy-L-fuconate hydrolase